MPLLGRGWIQLFSRPRESWAWAIITSLPLREYVAQPFGAAGGRRTARGQDGRGSASLLASFLLRALYIHKQTCLYLLCVIDTFCWGTEKQDVSCLLGFMQVVTNFSGLA